jgi:hypothetical protein
VVSKISVISEIKKVYWFYENAVNM